MDHQQSEHGYVKNLKKVKARGEPLERVVMVDDSPEKLIHQYGNLVRISPFEGQADDHELLLLMDYLQHLNQQPNVRRIEKRGWQQRMIHQAIQQRRAELYANDDTCATGKLI
jgi:TFIIF-interacting CTD phosphatase-like protein